MPLAILFFLEITQSTKEVRKLQLHKIILPGNLQLHGPVGRQHSRGGLRRLCQREHRCPVTRSSRRQQQRRERERWRGREAKSKPKWLEILAQRGLGSKGWGTKWVPRGSGTWTWAAFLGSPSLSLVSDFSQREREDTDCGRFISNKCRDSLKEKRCVSWAFCFGVCKKCFIFLFQI